MIQCLEEINCDNNIVGWYQSTNNEKFLTNQLIETQFNYQKEYGKKCVCLLIDPQKTKKGKLFLKAIRLTDRFMTILKKEVKNTQFQISQEELSKHKFNSEEIVNFIFKYSMKKFLLKFKKQK
jgi:hypothetical protein